MLFLPLHLIGLISNYIPYKIPDLFVEKKVNDPHFHSSIKMSMGVILFILFLEHSNNTGNTTFWMENFRDLCNQLTHASNAKLQMAHSFKENDGANSINKTKKVLLQKCSYQLQ